MGQKLSATTLVPSSQNNACHDDRWGPTDAYNTAALQSQIGALCSSMIYIPLESATKRTYDLHFDHHENETQLLKSTETCFVGRAIANKLPTRPTGYQAAVKSAGAQSAASALRIFRRKNAGVFRAGFSLLPDNQNNYSLEFYRKGFEIGSFVLKQANEAPYPPSATPISDNTGSDEVLQQVTAWIKGCTCVDLASAPTYPTRLSDIQWLKEIKPPREQPLKEAEQQRGKHVRLVLSKDSVGKFHHLDAVEMNKHVTLSHCWGKPKKAPLHLLKNNIEDFRKGIELGTLPLTFRHAIDFASRLDHVRYTWIDSFCIIQDDKNHRLYESERMGEVYSNSFLNISATAATNGEEGIFYKRRPYILCIVLDASFWDEHVDQAPVNRCGWVLQEWLMAPRKVHFCKEQVAWECLEGRKSGRHPKGLPTFQGEAEELVSGAKLEWLRAKRRLRETSDPEDEGIPREAYSAWKHIVERPPKYRAPSFPWAAVDADQGVTYGDFLDQDLLIKVNEITPEPPEGKAMFGMVKEGSLSLTGELPPKKIVLRNDLKDEGTVYSWELVGEGSTRFDNKYTILYLDSPERDTDIFGPDGRVYCLPAASGGHADEPGDLTCLLLQADKKTRGTFRRIGLTIISMSDAEGEERMRQMIGYEEQLPCVCWEVDASGTGRGRHTIRIA
ncbi:hypothetical protein B0J12DRAFT_701873 [Macrophomina phaseolina]|uniref:Heterokaryon incompatibility domain-containing protein n=1 Tax=Macrophomina phaseolina TaxID=35725 RepID=A0ABQ8G3J2_9PEZI|nr:hypothetical protein B0J12DRAFT_701873 [Macrophomina phaseolina]